MDFLEVTEEFRVDQYDNVYDEDGSFYCKWIALDEEEREMVKLNKLSAR